MKRTPTSGSTVRKWICVGDNGASSDDILIEMVQSGLGHVRPRISELAVGPSREIRTVGPAWHQSACTADSSLW